MPRPFPSTVSPGNFDIIGYANLVPVVPPSASKQQSMQVSQFSSLHIIPHTTTRPGPHWPTTVTLTSRQRGTHSTCICICILASVCRGLRGSLYHQSAGKDVDWLRRCPPLTRYRRNTIRETASTTASYGYDVSSIRELYQGSYRSAFVGLWHCCAAPAMNAGNVAKKNGKL